MAEVDCCIIPPDEDAMPNLEDYKWEFRKEEEELLAERRKLLGQKQLISRVFTTEASRRRAELEKAVAELERRITEIRNILGDNYRNN
ncbi:hypothetical protein DD509_03845 [Dehalogenimonas alkenigignens]|uniref:Uncharacterized protein n=2 Tax=Dehalogenimonas TaxID=670486 RepID=A0A0W0GI06_9CHLR|nr:hypothetical protein DEALK_10410 [Dehalogenimonas alkenigignens]PVV84435.1 hypothetical protein DD509_03845 [Dehalogenimonas alkenigignens]